MELVLGLAALATAISSVGGASYIKDDPNMVEAEPLAAQKMSSNPHQYEISEGVNLPESHIGDFDGSIKPWIRDLIGDEIFVRRESEGNNTPETANDLDGCNGKYDNYASTGPSDHSSTIYGKISSASDVDWYKLTIYGRAQVKFTVTRPSDHDFCVVQILKKEEQIKWRPDLPPLKTSYHYSGGTSPVISGPMNPGVYFVKVGSPEGGFCSNDYSLTVDVTYKGQDYSMDYLAEKGAKAALWLCDYDPFGFRPKTSFEPLQIGDRVHASYAFSGSETKDFLSDSAFPMTPGQIYKQAELFIWDVNYRESVRDYVRDLRAAVMSYFANNADKQRLSLDVQRTTSGLSFIVTLYAAKYKLVDWTLTAYGLTTDLTNILNPQGAVYDNKTELLQYLEGIYATLNHNSDTGSREVVRIPIGYRIRKGDHYWKYYDFETDEIWPYTFEYCPFIQDDYLYDRTEHQNTIYSHDFQGNNPINGTIFPLVYYRDIEKTLNRSNKYDLTTTDLTLNRASNTFSLTSDECKWFKFTAPHAGDYRIRSSGSWNAAVHVCTDTTFIPSAYNDKVIAREYRTPGYEDGFSYDFHLNAGDVRYFRVCGSVDNYNSLGNTTVVVTQLAAGMVARFSAEDLGLPNNLNNPFFFGNLSNPCNVFYSSCGAFYNTDRGAIELLCDRDNNKPFAYIIMFFGRPIKQLNFGSCIGNSYSYACLNLYLQGLNQYGFPVTEDVVDTYCNDHLLPYGLRYDNRDEAICGVMFRIDPETDTSPYHVGYQEQLLGDFVVEFND